jgi:hypothetical protein
MGYFARRKNRFLSSGDQEASRLVAIRTIVDLAADDEDHDVVAEALLVLGASQTEISTAKLGAGQSGPEDLFRPW